MQRKTSIGFVLACSIALLASVSTAQEAILTPIPDPIASPDVVSGHRIAGKILIEALQDLEKSQASDYAANSWPGFYSLLVSNWKLEFQSGKRGGVAPLSARLVDTTRTTNRDGMVQIPKEVALLGMAIRLADSQQSSFDKAPAPSPSPAALPSSDELDLVCGNDWILSWLEDENGNVIPGSTELYCGGTVIPL